ncbi:MAG: PilZ domain-containing protein [Myxococcaceae bacterium]
MGATGERQRVLIADRDGPWRTEFAQALRSESIDVQETASGDHALEVLKRGDGFRALILGEELSEMGGFAVLVQASRGRRGGLGVPAVLFVCDVGADSELQELLRKRGVTEFVRRQDLLTLTVDRVRDLLFADRRVAPRVKIRLPAQLTLGTNALKAHIEDLNASGCQVSTAMKRVSGLPEAGTSVALSFGHAGRLLEIHAEVRRAYTRKQLLGDQLVLGLKFNPLSEEDKTNIHRIIEQSLAMADALAASWNIV